MPCPNFDVKNNMCKALGQKFYKGMQKPCDAVNDPAQCPLLIMRGK